MKNRKARKLAGASARAGGAVANAAGRVAWRFRWQLAPYSVALTVVAVGVLLRVMATVGGWWLAGTAAAIAAVSVVALYQAASRVPVWYLAAVTVLAAAGVTVYTATDNPNTGLLSAAWYEASLLVTVLFAALVTATIVAVPWWMRFASPMVATDRVHRWWVTRIQPHVSALRDARLRRVEIDGHTEQLYGTLKPGMTISQLKNVIADVESAGDTPAGAVRVERDHDGTARDFVMTVVRSSALENRNNDGDDDGILHPIVGILDELEARAAAEADGDPHAWDDASELVLSWRPGARSVHDPIPMGVDELGNEYSEPYWTPEHGAIHGITAGQTGSGKGGVRNAALVGLVACRDVALVSIDTAKGGRGDGSWGGAIAYRGRNTNTAVALLRYQRRLARWRTATSEQHAMAAGLPVPDKHVPTPEQPLVVVQLDELPALLRGSDAAYDVLLDLAQQSRSEAIALDAYLQDAGRDAMGVGSTALRDQLARRRQLRIEPSNVNKAAMLLADTDLDPTELVHKGSYLAQLVLDPSKPADGYRRRSYKVEPDHIARIARLYRGERTVTVEPNATAELGAVPNDVPVLVTSGAATPVGAGDESGRSEHQPDPTEVVPMPERPDLDSEIGDAIAAMEAVANGEPVHGDRPDLGEADPDSPSDPVNAAILATLDDAGTDGARAGDLDQALIDAGLYDSPRSAASTRLRRCRTLLDATLIARHGTGNATRWYLPRHAPGAGDEHTAAA